MPQIGGNNLWRLIKRIQKVLKVAVIGRDRLAKLLIEYGLYVRWPKRRTPKTTYSGHRYAVQPNRFKDITVGAPNQVWVADITHIAVEESPAYLFLLTDAFSRKIVGYHLAKTLHAEGAVLALKSALKAHKYPQKVIHHSDRGIQYCCHNFLDELKRWNLQSSMTDADHCAQNALAECMNGILKREFLLGLEFETFKQALHATAKSIDTYNNFRIHGSLDGRTPAESHRKKPIKFIERWAKMFAASLPQTAKLAA